MSQNGEVYILLTSYAERASPNGDSEASGGDKHSSITHTVLEMINTNLNIPMTADSIMTVFRLKAGPRDRTRPILVKFSTRGDRDTVIKAKKLLRSKNIPVYISEHLTKPAAERFSKARGLVKEKKIFSAWSFNGQVFIKKSDGARPHIVNSLADLSL